MLRVRDARVALVAVICLSVLAKANDKATRIKHAARCFYGDGNAMWARATKKGVGGQVFFRDPFKLT